MTEKELLAPENWPECPSCGTEALVVGGAWCACPSCSFMGQTKSLAPSPALDLVRVRAAIKGDGFGAVVFVAKNSSSYDPIIVDELRLVISQRLVHERVWRSVRSSMSPGGLFTPLCVMNFNRNDRRYLTLRIDTADRLLVAKNAAASHDIVSVMWLSKDAPSGEFCDDDARSEVIGESGFFNVHTHFYGAPSIVMTTSYRLVGGALKFGVPVFHHLHPLSWISQPICWSVVKCVPGRVFPEFLAVRKFPDGTVVNACACEDMDGAPRCGIAVQTSPGGLFFSTDVPARTLREGIADLSERVKKIDLVAASKQVLPDVVSTSTWEPGTDPRLVLGGIRTMDIWNLVGRN